MKMPGRVPLLPSTVGQGPMYLYPVGRGVKRLTEQQFLRLRTVANLDPEMQRRVMALMRAAVAAGVLLSLSGGWRDGTFAEQEFYRRYTRTTQTRRLKITDKKYDSAWWSLNPGEIGCATPYNGLHTYGPPGTPREFIPLPQAVDFYGDLKWMHANCTRFGLRWFPKIPGEAHHAQPAEGCTSRSEYNPAKHPLIVWPLPPEGDTDMAQRVRADGDTAELLLSGVDVVWVRDGNVSAALEKVHGPLITCPRLAFAMYHGTGPFPNSTLKPTDFASWVEQ